MTELSLSIDDLEQGFNFFVFYVLLQTAEAREFTTIEYTMLPNLKHLELRGHEIEPHLLLGFIKERKSTLQSVRLEYIRDGDCTCDNIGEDISDLLRCTDGEVKVEVIETYDGNDWRPDWSMG